MKKSLLMATGLIALSIPAMAQNAEVRVTPDTLVWKDNPAFPKGVQVAILVGDPTKVGEVVVLRIKFPPNFQMPPHTHPYSEVVTLVSGSVGSSHGEKFEKKGDLLKPGSLWVYPAKHPHYAWTGSEGEYFKFNLPARVASTTSIRLTIRASSSQPLALQETISSEHMCPERRMSCGLIQKW